MPKHHVTFVGTPRHDYRNCTKEAYLESQDVRLDPEMGRTSRGQCPNCDVPHLEFALVHGVTNSVILLKIA